MSLLDRLKQLLKSDERINSDDTAELNSINWQDVTSAYYRNEDILLEEKRIKVAKLTPREYDLYLLLLEGFTIKESAKQLTIKYSTANTHMSAIYKKLGVHTRAELIINYRCIYER